MPDRGDTNAIRRGSSRRAPPPSLPSRPTAHNRLSSTHPEPASGGAPFDPPTSHMPAPTGQLISAPHCERLPSAPARHKGKESHNAASHLLSFYAPRWSKLDGADQRLAYRSEEHTSELQSLMRISYAVYCLKKKIKTTNTTTVT